MQHSAGTCHTALSRIQRTCFCASRRTSFPGITASSSGTGTHPSQEHEQDPGPRYLNPPHRSRDTAFLFLSRDRGRDGCAIAEPSCWARAGISSEVPRPIDLKWCGSYGWVGCVAQYGVVCSICELFPFLCVTLCCERGRREWGERNDHDGRLRSDGGVKLQSW
jgi:hypothetical protein